MSEWKKLHDRELVLAGTVMAIIYRPGRDGDLRFIQAADTNGHA